MKLCFTLFSPDAVFGSKQTKPKESDTYWRMQWLQRTKTIKTKIKEIGPTLIKVNRSFEWKMFLTMMICGIVQEYIPHIGNNSLMRAESKGLGGNCFMTMTLCRVHDKWEMLAELLTWDSSLVKDLPWRLQQQQHNGAAINYTLSWDLKIDFLPNYYCSFRLELK